MIAAVQRLVPPFHHKSKQPVHASLTNTQLIFLSDTDAKHLAALLKPIQRLLQMYEGTGQKATHVDPPSALFKVGLQLDRGIARKGRPNEDSLFMAQSLLHTPYEPPTPFAFFVVADGMGGHMYGQEASQLAISSLTTSVYTALCTQDSRSDMFPHLLQAGILQANQVLYQRNQVFDSNMGTTMTALLVHGSTAYLAHAGDSRAYLYHTPTGLVRLTCDHSLVAALVKAGVIQLDEIYTHPARNQIYRSLGEKPTLEVDTDVVSLAAGDTILLCSDGLWEMVHDPQIASILAQPAQDPAEIAQTLVQAALKGGGDDNISVIVGQVNRV